jgi:SAM-dependent methyltransferase
MEEPLENEQNTQESVPKCASDYAERLSRNSRCNPRLTDVDWLVRRGLVKVIAYAAKHYASGALLDVGCGGKPYERCFSPYVRSYVGLDTPASTLSLADVVGFADNLPFEDCCFDTVLCSSVVEHLAAPQKAIEEMFRVLRPGGHLILTAPQMWHLHEEPWDFYRYTIFGLRHLVQDAGFEILRETSYAGPWSMLGVFFIIHSGSYPQWFFRKLSSNSAPRRGTRQSNSWQKWFLPFRIPIAIINILCAALDCIPHPGVYWVENAVIAKKQGD